MLFKYIFIVWNLYSNLHITGIINNNQFVIISVKKLTLILSYLSIKHLYILLNFVVNLAFIMLLKMFW